MHENRETSEIPVANLSHRTAGEGSGRTARMYVCEGSHRGIVPMNHSNQDRTTSAESEEGRLRLKENTFPLDTYPTQSGTVRVPWVGECADKLSVWPLSIREVRVCAGGTRQTGVPTAINNHPIELLSTPRPSLTCPFHRRTILLQ
jgi:hypothetical protein